MKTCNSIKSSFSTVSQRESFHDKETINFCYIYYQVSFLAGVSVRCGVNLSVFFITGHILLQVIACFNTTYHEYLVWRNVKFNSNFEIEDLAPPIVKQGAYLATVYVIWLHIHFFYCHWRISRNMFTFNSQQIVVNHSFTFNSPQSTIQCKLIVLLFLH